MNRPLSLRLPLVLLLAGIALLIPTTAARARCAPRGLEVTVLTPTTVQIPRDGSFLIQLSHTRRRGHAVGGVFPDDLRLQGSGRRVGLDLTLLAPGLARATPRRRVRAGTYRLAGSGVGSINRVQFSASSAVPPLATPDVLRVSHEMVEVRGRRRPRTRASVRLELSAPLGAGAIALVVAIVDPSAAVRRLPRGGWRAVEPGLEPALTTPRGRCDAMPTGTDSPSVGDEVRVGVVDAYGRVADGGVHRVVSR